MTERDCEDCPVESGTHELLAEALRAGALDVFARSDLAADAIDLAEAEARVRRPRLGWRRPLLSAAAILLVGVGLWALIAAGAPEAEEPGEEDATRAAGSVAAERAANQAFLDSPKTQARVAQVQDGQWIGIQHGKTLVVAADLGALDLLLKQAERDGSKEGLETVRPKARHRFTFRKGREGDKAFKTFFGKPPFVGAEFINFFGFAMSSGEGRIRYRLGIDSLKQGKVLDVPWEKGKGATMPLHLGEPTSLGGIEVVAGFSTGSEAPLVLPLGMMFPRFEIPGVATLEGGSDHPGTFRRCVASVSIPSLGVREVFVEAIGHGEAFEQDDGSLRIGNQTWQPDTKARRLAAAESGRPLLILERQRWMARYPGNPLAGLPREGLDAALVHYDLLWKELPRKATWVGGGEDAPPAEARLTVVDPRDERIVRMLVVRPWTSQRHVTTLLATGLREFEVGETRFLALAEKEGMAMRSLMAIVSAQAAAHSMGIIDADGDGTGEFATLAELTGASAGRRKAKLRPPLLPNSFVPRGVGGDLVLGGYRIRLFLPGSRNPPLLVVGGGPDREVVPIRPPPYVTRVRADSRGVDIDKAEAHWWAYAWPEELGVSGRRAFYTDQSGDIWATERWAGVYEGTHAAPNADAAFASPNRYPGGVSPALVSADGNRWVRLN